MARDTVDPESGEAAQTSDRNPKRWVIATVVGVVAGVLVWLIGSAVLPRWWAQRMGGIVDGRLTTGTLLGMSTGAVFTLLPIFVLLAGWRFRKSWRRALLTLVVAVALAAPNLATLSIVLGTSNAAHAGERILDVEGPGFRGGSLVGSVVGILLGIGVAFLASSRRRNKRKAKALKAELDAEKA